MSEDYSSYNATLTQTFVPLNYQWATDQEVVELSSVIL